MILWFAWIALTLGVCTVLLWRQLGKRGTTWAWVEVAWSLLSLAALGLGLVQLNDKLSEMRIAKVHSDMMTRWGQYQGETARMLGMLSDTDRVQSMARTFLTNVPQVDDMSFEHRLVTVSKKPSLGALGNLSELSTPLCGSTFGPQWTTEVKRRFDSIHGDNSMSKDQFLYETMVSHCLESRTISELANEEERLQNTRRNLSSVYEVGWLWAYALGVGLVLKLLKAISDLMSERRSKIKLAPRS
jgi:hypothetical protein